MSRAQIPNSRKLRCSHCRAVLGVVHPRGIAVRRADFQGIALGWHDVVCYRCGTLNYLDHPSRKAVEVAAD